MPPPRLPPRTIASIRRRLLRWYARRGRDLSWRGTRDPWAVLVSEIMLQQTRVETVERYWPRFLARFPTPRSLARAPLERVLKAWEGLGYYGRARRLREAARVLVREHGGRVPGDFEALLALPGLGRSTAGGVASIVFSLPEPVLDGNVRRVLARLARVEGDSGASDEEILWGVARTLLPERSPGDWNQALMDLGATVCLPRTPRCSDCPLAPHCRARRAGVEGEIPPRGRKAPPRTARLVAAWIERGGKILLVREKGQGLLGGLWGLPTLEVPPGGSDRRSLDLLAKRLGLAFAGEPAPAGAPIRRRFTHIDATYVPYRALAAGRGPSPPGGRWAAPGAVRRLPISTAHRKLVALLAGSKVAGGTTHLV